jgi:NADPH-dependent glutamate synthase beta subunit-like oxidoreductase
VRHERDLTLVVLDNGTTGMTGHQPHPGTATAGEPQIDIEALARAAGVKHVAVIDPMNLKDSARAIRTLLANSGPKVLISRSPCPLFVQKMEGRTSPTVRYAVDHDKCMFCGREDSCLYCGLDPFRDYSLARGRARVAAGPAEAGDYSANAPAKMQTPPCEAACPLGLCVQGYVTAAAANDFARARALIRQRLVLPHVVCRVCPHPCEDICIRGDVDQPVAINAIKRFVMDGETDDDRRKYVERTRGLIIENGKKAAVIGAGPAGLGCAFDLRLRGYRVTIFEAERRAGGMAFFGIPRHRLPREALLKDLDVIADLGVEFRFGVRFGRDISLADLKKQNFSAVFVSPGLAGSLRLGVAGDDLPGVVGALEWLHQVNVEGLATVPPRVMVVGGGNAAVDAARCALRLGAREVSLLYRRTRREMPAIKEEVAAALAEGVRLVELVTPEQITRAPGALSIVCRHMRLGEPDVDGRRKPEPTDETHAMECDLLLVAIGQQSSVPDDALPNVPRDRWGRLVVNRATGATGDPFVFAGGDAVTGPATVVEALQSGKCAAYGIDAALSGDPRRVMVEAPRDREALLAEPRYRPVAVEVQQRQQQESLDAAEAVRSFDEVERGLDAEQAAAEARRCLACGLCATCDNCLQNFGCPAFFRVDGKVQIDPLLCDGCGLCVQVCPNGAIVPVSEGAS